MATVINMMASAPSNPAPYEDELIGSSLGLAARLELGTNGGSNGFRSVDRRRDRHREGTRRQGRPRGKPAKSRPIRKAELRGDARRTDRKRTVRSRTRGFHRRVDADHRPLSTGPSGNIVSRRNRRLASRIATQALARPAGTGVREARAARARFASTFASWRQPIRIWRKWSGSAGSAPTCFTG